MIPVEFDYLAPTSVEEALAALGQHGDDAKILAGGQSLLPVLRMRLNAPEVVIDLGGISSLRGIRDDGDALVIGAMTTHHDVRDDAWSRSTRSCCPRPPRRSRTRRSGTAAPSAARWHTPTPPVTSVRRHSRSARSSSSPVPVAPARSTPRTSSSTSSRPPSVTTRSSPRCASPSTPAGAPTTRSSCGWPTSGPSSPSPRRSGARSTRPAWG